MFAWKIKIENENYFIEKDRHDSSFQDFHPIIRKILFNRNLRTIEEIKDFFNPCYETGLLDPFLFVEMKKVVERIKIAIQKKEKLAIFGDYDADGVTSAAVLQEVLEKIGIKDSIVYIPDKHTEGYGMNLKALSELSKQGISLVITVDCGIANVEETEAALKMKMDVIIIDHHYVQENIPPATAIINPHHQNSGYPFAPLAGVGVVFKVAQALYQKFIPQESEQLKWLLDLVAIGTVADCVPLIGENRIIVKYGLIVLSKTRRVGLQEMMAVGRVPFGNGEIFDTRKISFQIAPRINAAGRMDHANLAFNLVREQSTARARDLSLEIESNNQARQKETARVVESVEVLARNSFRDKKFIFAVSEHYPAGVVGLVAGKIAEKYQKPTAVLQKGETESKGSFRGIPQVNIIQSLEACGDLLKKFGGHPQAAGITIANENLDAFYEAFLAIVEKQISGEIKPELEIDTEISPAEVDFQLTEALLKMEPFGEGNREPIFAMRRLSVNNMQAVGNGNKHLKLFLRPNDGTPKIFEAIGFGMGEKFSGIKPEDLIDIAFKIKEDSWNGNKKIQFVLEDIRRSQES